MLRLGSNITQATNETTTEGTTQSTTASTIQSTTQTTTQTTTEPTSEVTTENTTHAEVPTTAYVGSDTILASDVLASHPNGIGGNGTADDPEEIYIGAGVYVVNGGSAFQQKDKYLYSGGKTFDVEFQIGKGNENIPSNATSVKLPIEKGLKFDVGGSGFAKIYTGIGSSEVEEMQLLVADSTGKIINKITVDNIGAGEIFFPSAGVYYVFNPAKQASWNLAAIDIGIYGTVNEYVFGDADGDNVVTASDAAFVLQKTLVSTFELPIEKKTNEWLKYADVDCDSYITASDAAFILQKTLVSTFELPAEQNA